MTWHFLDFLVLLFGGAFYALWGGGKPERYTAVALVTAFLVNIILRRPGHMPGVEVTTLVIDSILMVVLMTIALTANRRWPLLMAALHALTLMGHAAKFVADDLDRYVYVAMIVAWSHPMSALVIVGTWRHRVRTVDGPESDWSIAWHRRLSKSASTPAP